MLNASGTPATEGTGVAMENMEMMPTIAQISL